MAKFWWTWRNFSKHHQNTRIWVFFPQPSVFFLRACDFTTIPSGKYNKNFVELSLSLSFSSEKSLFRIETNSERTILILPSFFFFCDFNIITKTSCGEVNTKDRNSFKRILTSLFIRLYKNNPSHRISERKKIDKNWSCKFASFKNTPSKQESIDHKKLLLYPNKGLSNNPKIISVITSN